MTLELFSILFIFLSGRTINEGNICSQSRQNTKGEDKTTRTTREVRKEDERCRGQARPTNQRAAKESLQNSRSRRKTKRTCCDEEQKVIALKTPFKFLKARIICFSVPRFYTQRKRNFYTTYLLVEHFISLDTRYSKFTDSILV